MEPFLKLFKKDLPKLILVVVALMLFFSLYPLYDLNYGYLNRLEKRAAILKTLYEIKQYEIKTDAAVKNDTVLQKEYRAILSEIAAYDPSINTYFAVLDKPTSNRKLFDTLACGVVWIPFLVLFGFNGAFKPREVQKIKGKETFFYKIGYQIKSVSLNLILFAGLFFSGLIIGAVVPSFKVASINYVLLPSLEILLFLVINKLYQSTKRQREQETKLV